MDWGLLPAKAVEMLRATRHDPGAVRRVELMTTSFMWSDETGGVPGSWAPVRALFGYRGSLQRGRPDESLREAWDQLLAACPEWVGFRPERCSPDLRGELEREYAVLAEEFTRGLERWGSPDAEPAAAPPPAGE